MKELAALVAIPVAAVAVIAAVAYSAVDRPPTPTPVRIAADGCGGRPEPDCRLTTGCRPSYGPSLITGNSRSGVSATTDMAFQGCGRDSTP